VIITCISLFLSEISGTMRIIHPTPEIVIPLPLVRLEVIVSEDIPFAVE